MDTKDEYSSLLLPRDKHTSLLRKFVIYGQKSFITGPVGKHYQVVEVALTSRPLADPVAEEGMLDPML
jgi:hypothetical protein